MDGKEGEFIILWTSELKQWFRVVKLIKLMCLPPPYHIETNSKYFHFVEPRALTCWATAAARMRRLLSVSLPRSLARSVTSVGQEKQVESRVSLIL